MMKSLPKWGFYHLAFLASSCAQGDENKAWNAADDLVNQTRNLSKKFDSHIPSLVTDSETQERETVRRKDAELDLFVRNSQIQADKFEKSNQSEITSLIQQSHKQAKENKGSARETLKACRMKIPGSRKLLKGENETFQGVRNDQIMIFVSSSMPKESLRSLFIEAQKVGGKLVFRGLIDNSFRKTQQYFMDLKISADINPVFFEEHHVTHVPVFLIEDKKQKKMDFIRGHISLTEALSTLKSRGDLKEKAQKLYQNMVGRV